MSELDITNKICSSCKEEKHITAFSPREDGADGFRNSCRKCRSESCELTRNKENRKLYNSEYYTSKARERHLRHKFGITLDQYEELLNRQENCCAVCKRHKDNFKTNLAVDHDHITGEIRGLLCTHCNRYHVGRHRNGDLLRNIASYVEGGTGWFVPEKKPKKRKKIAK